MIPSVLITNVTLSGRTGTEIVTRDLALGFRRRGRAVSVYAPALGEIARELSAAGIDVCADLDAFAVAPDIVHGHHHAETIQALVRFPRARGVFVCHDRTAPASAPPRMDRIRRYVAVDANCRERFADNAIPDGRARVILNAVDVDRFPARLRLPRRPRRALIFSHYASEATHVRPIREACAALELPVDVMGSLSGTASPAPESRLGDYDVVFAKARCALEAMVAGAAVVLADAAGLGPMVTSAEWPALRPWNFGARLLTASLGRDGLLRELRRYDSADAARVTELSRTSAGLGSALDDYGLLYDEILHEPVPAQTAEETLAEYLRCHVERLGALELALAGYRQPHRMERLSDEACSGLSVRVTACPSSLAADSSTDVDVRLENGSTTALGSHPPYPVQWSYRWLRAGTNEVVVPEGVRTAFATLAEAGAASSHVVRVVAPATPGHYVLRLTLVQEWQRWLDTLRPPVSADTGVDVRAMER